ncbi:MAG: response regulator [Candidatus Omnitrophica bacterium]|nr:response regulator [Candidatus Omnitrophota bacterium]
MGSILVVDDEEKIRRIYGDLFVSEGHEVFKTSNVIDAHELFKKRTFDIVLLDINLPQVDGRVFYTLLRTFNSRSKVIVCSVCPVEDQIKLIEGAAGYYDKSQSLDVLRNRVKEVLNS